MTELFKINLLKVSKPRAETLMEKTTRAVTEILDEETEKRKVKTDRLRKARLEREANTPSETRKETSSRARTKHPAKTVR
jgi:hypothetical protein